MGAGGRARRGLACALALAAASGCVERGDFGRVKPSVWNEIVSQTGAVAAASRGEPVSPNPLTDDEQELRGRAWRFLVPARDRPWFDRALAELVATRVVPADAIEPDGSAYHRGLRMEGGRSPASMYRRLSEDAAADARLVGPFARTAIRVLAADRIRLAALARVAQLSEADVYAARARVAFNRCLIAWVTSASAFRLAAYRYALEHLVIEAPQRDAVPTERALALLAAERTRLDALGVTLPGCAGDLVIEAPPPDPGSGLPLVRKG